MTILMNCVKIQKSYRFVAECVDDGACGDTYVYKTITTTTTTNSAILYLTSLQFLCSFVEHINFL